MSYHDLSPTTEKHRTVTAFHCVGEESDLPLIDETGSDDWDVQTADSPKSSVGRRLIRGVVLAMTVAATAFWFQAGNPEQRHENWKHVAAASDSSTEFAQQLIHIDEEGNSQALRSISVSRADLSQNASPRNQSVLSSSGPTTAISALHSLQNLQAVAKAAAMNPAITLANAMRNGRAELFEIELFDCCDEDGDVVEILLNGAPFAAVPLTHGGSVVAIPLAPGRNSITVLATHDGGGGVTVSLRTSHGEYFARYMDEGESHQMGVVVQ